MSEPLWLTRQMIEAIHDEQLATYGGASGLRDEGMLESALDRPRNKWSYDGGEVDENGLTRWIRDNWPSE
jgi:death-on-curing protein